MSKNIPKEDKEYYEMIIRAKDKEIEYLKKANDEISKNNKKETSDYYETVLEAKEKEIEYLRRKNENNQEVNYYLSMLEEKDKEINEINIYANNLQSDKESLLVKVLNFMENNCQYISYDFNKSGEISLNEIEDFFTNIDRFISRLITDNKNLISRQNNNEEDKLKNLNDILNELRNENIQLK